MQEATDDEIERAEAVMDRALANIVQALRVPELIRLAVIEDRQEQAEELRKAA